MATKMSDIKVRNEDKQTSLTGRGKGTDAPKWAVNDGVEQTAHEYNNPENAVDAWNKGQVIPNLRTQDANKTKGR